jgi:hypothetical protein
VRARACVLACMCAGTRKHTRKRRPLHPFGMAHTRSLFALLSHACHARSHARAHAHKQARTHTHARTHARTHAHKCVLTQGRDRPHGRRRRRVRDFREADQRHRAGGQREQVSAAQCMEGHVRAGSQRVCAHVRPPCSSSVSRGGEGRQREARRTICRTRCAGASMRARRSSRPTASRSWRSRRAPLPDRCDRGLRPSRRRSRAGVRAGVRPAYAEETSRVPPGVNA